MKRQPPIAIVGIGGLFPGSLDVGTFWRHILNKSDLVTEVPASHWRASDYLDAAGAAPGKDGGSFDKTYAARGAFLPPVPFDPLSLGLPPSLLSSTDTSQLLALLVARSTLQDAFATTEARSLDKADRTRIACILGVTSGQELFGQMAARLAHPQWKAGMRAAGIEEQTVQLAAKKIADSMVPWTEATFPGLLGNVVAGRIANRLDLGGTNAVTDAACASSFAALSMAIDELVLERADVVLTGGVDTLNDIFMYMCFSKTPALSPSGDCRPLDASADGTLLGEGLGMIALKRLQDAERDGNHIYAVIKGVGTSSDGRSKSVYAPVPEGQAQALRRAYQAAGHAPTTVELIEAHGTGTRAGDAAEIAGMKLAFDEPNAQGNKPRRQWCAVGSVKSQIGHTKSAAGAAGLLKVALALHHKVIPPTIKVTTPNPAARFEESPFYVATKARPWVRPSTGAHGHPRRASVSSFGFGGSNFHVALEEYTGPAARPARLSRRSCEVIALSAPDDVALKERARALTAALMSASLSAVAREAAAAFQSGDKARASFVAFTSDEATAFLHATAEGREVPGLFRGAGEPGAVAFLFPGQGSQHTDMAAAVAMEFDAARAALDVADELALRSGARLSQLMFPPTAFSDEGKAAHERELTRTEHAQPALGAASLAFLRALESLSVSFDMAAGHSFGELSALCAAGAFDERTLLSLARTRGELMAEASAGAAGAMAAIIGDARAHLPDALSDLDVVIANENAPDQTVISGSSTGVAEAGRRLAARGLTVKHLEVSTAFHSPSVAGACAPLAAALAALPMRAPHKPVYANTTAAPHTDLDSMRAELSRQVRERVRFVDELNAMYNAGARVFVEVGPGQVLTGLVQRTLPAATAIATGGRTSDGLKPFLTALARLCAAGVLVDLSRLPETAPSQAPIATKTSVMVSGSNLGKPALPTPAPSPAAPSRLVSSASATSPAPAITQAPPPPAPSRPGASMTSSKSPTLTNGWLEVLREGQRQTADAHIAFQRSLTDAHAAYLQTVESTQNALVAALSGNAPVVIERATPRALSAPAARTHESHVAEGARAFEGDHNHEPMRSHDQRDHEPARSPEPARNHDQRNREPAHDHVPAPAAHLAHARDGALPLEANEKVDVRALLLAVVADKTGYPQDSLDDSMNMEADLGIDSIKRVEILGALKDRLPSAASLDALQLAQLKTLGEIAAALSKGAHVNGTNGAHANGAGGALLATLIEVVADKTGYPKDALSPSMALESDLGVDSIKRVEILSALKERVPHLPTVDAVKLAQLQTIGEIASALEGHRPF